MDGFAFSPKSTTKTRDSGIESLGHPPCDDARTTDLDQGSSLTTGNEQVDQALLWHLAYCERLLEVSDDRVGLFQTGWKGNPFRPSHVTGVCDLKVHSHSNKTGPACRAGMATIRPSNFRKGTFVLYIRAVELQKWELYICGSGTTNLSVSGD